MRQGGLAVAQGWPAGATWRRLRAEARECLAGAEESRLAVSDASGPAPRRFLRATGGPAQRAFYHGRRTLGFLRRMTGVTLAPTGERGGYLYYTRPGDWLGIHRDRDDCDLAVITCLADTAGAGGEGGILVCYPGRLAERISAIRARPRRGAVAVRLRPGESLVMFGGWLAHAVRPVVRGQTRIVSALCYRLGPPARSAEDRRGDRTRPAGGVHERRIPWERNRRSRTSQRRRKGPASRTSSPSETRG